MKPYPTDTNQITIKTLNQSNTMERERERERERAILVIDVEPLRTAFEERESDVETERASE